LTGGGDVPPLNAVIASAKKTSNEVNVELIGFIKGWLGVIENQYIDLSKINFNSLIEGTILKSSSAKLEKTAGGIDQAKQNIKKLRLDGLIVINGEDTLSNSFNLLNIPLALNSKTIDNDIGTINSSNEGIINYFTLGFPTAARKISSFVSHLCQF